MKDDDRCKHCGIKTNRICQYSNHDQLDLMVDRVIVCQKCYDQCGYNPYPCNCNQCRKRRNKRKHKDEKKKKDVLFQSLQTGITSYMKGSKVITKEEYNEKVLRCPMEYRKTCICIECEKLREYERSLKMPSPKIIDTNGYIVISRMQGPSRMPAVHKTFDSACKEAARLAKLAPEDSFVVYRPVVVASATKPVEPKVNYRMCMPELKQGFEPEGTEGIKSEGTKKVECDCPICVDRKKKGMSATNIYDMDLSDNNFLAWIMHCI